MEIDGVEGGHQGSTPAKNIRHATELPPGYIATGLGLTGAELNGRCIAFSTNKGVFRTPEGGSYRFFVHDPRMEGKLTEEIEVSATGQMLI